MLFSLCKANDSFYNFYKDNGGMAQPPNQSETQSEALQQAILDNIVDGLITIDRFGIVLSFNKAAETIFQYSADEVIGHNVNMLMPEPYHAQHDGYLQNYLNTGEAKIIGIGREVSGLRKNGSTFPMDLSVSKIAIDDQLMFAGLVRDISEQKQAEEVKSRLAAIIASSEDAIISKSLDGIISSWNPAAEHMFGYSADEAIGQPMKLIIPPDYLQEEPEILQKIASGERYEHFETVRIKKDGTRLDISASISPIKNHAGRIIGVSTIARDVSDRKKAERELLEYSNRLDLATRAGGIGIWDYDLESGRLQWDSQMFEIYGIEPEQFPEAYIAWQTALHPEDREEANQAIDLAISGEQEFDTEFRIIRPDGSIHTIKAAAIVLRGWHNKPVRMIGVNWDITRQKEIENMKNEFISTVSHELRTPLTSIQGSLELVSSGVLGQIPEEAKPLLDIAVNNSARLVRLINDILDIEKIESGKMEFLLKPVEVMALVKQVVAANQAYAKEFQVTLTIVSDIDEVFVQADTDRLVQVLTNLLSNAAKFSPKGGTVELAVRCVENNVRISVTDHGTGIASSFKDKIFSKFSQADSSSRRQKGGTGLGLSICKALIEKMNGQIDYYSDPDIETCFYVDLPLYQQQAELVTLLKTSADKSILICEDDPDVATLLKMMLQEHGYGVDVAMTAEQAKQKLQQRQYAAMTLDLLLPDQHGIDLFREIRTMEQTQQLPIIVVSAIADEGKKALNGDALAVTDWLSKPIDGKRLQTAISQALRQKKDNISKILHIEDDPDIVTLVKTLFKGKAVIEVAGNLTTAREKLSGQYDLIILDLTLPDGSGISLFKDFARKNPPIPVLIFSAQECVNKMDDNISAWLVKSRTGNEDLIKSIESILNKDRNHYE
jgi:PAS domain S-box-containing protein